MNKLIIEYLEGLEKLAEADFSPDGTYQLRSSNPQFTEFITPLIDQAISNNPQLPLRTGETTFDSAGQVVANTTLADQISVSDPQYPTALAEMFNHQKLEFQSKRLRFHATIEK